MKRTAGFLSLVLSAFLTSTANAQPAEDCTGADLDPSSTLPFRGDFTPTSSDFSLFGLRCSNPAPSVDAVVCFVPTNDCVVDYSCSFVTSVKYAVNARDMGDGACTTANGICVTAHSGDVTPPATKVLSNVSLTAGNNYCFICSTGDMEQQAMEITAVSGDCRPFIFDDGFENKTTTMLSDTVPPVLLGAN